MSICASQGREGKRQGNVKTKMGTRRKMNNDKKLWVQAQEKKEEGKENNGKSLGFY